MAYLIDNQTLMKLARSAFTSLFLLAMLWLPVRAAFAADNVTVNVTVEGLSGKLLDNAKAYLQIANLDAQQSYRGFQVRYLHRQAEREIKRALQPYGYYQVNVRSTLAQEGNEWLANYQVELNEPVIIDQYQWQIVGEGSDDPVLTKQYKQLALAQGQQLSHPDYQRLKSALLSTAIQQGYHQADYRQAQVVVDTKTNSATVEVTFDTGPQFYFGEVELTASHLDQQLLERYPRFSQGEPLRLAKLSAFQVDLTDSEYFSQVQASAAWEQADEQQQVPIVVETSANKRDHYRYGIGYGTDTGARLSFGLDRRWVNQQGHQFRSLLQLSQYESRATAVYHIPGEKPQTDYYQLRAELGDKENDSQDSRIYKLEALDIYTFDRWQREYKLTALQEDFTIGQQNDSAQFIIPAVNWRILTANERININNGWRLSLGISGAMDNLLSDTDLLRGYAEFKSVWGFADGWRLLNRVELGAIYTDDFYRLPPSLRFFAGGDNSVRGYAYEQLGPEDPSGAVIGGKYLAVASAELDYRVADNWRVAVFTDIGNSMLEPNQPLRQSIGAGVRWIAPIGSIRLDLARAIDEPGQPWRIHFTLGPDL